MFNHYHFSSKLTLPHKYLLNFFFISAILALMCMLFVIPGRKSTVCLVVNNSEVLLSCCITEWVSFLLVPFNKSVGFMDTGNFIFTVVGTK